MSEGKYCCPNCGWAGETRGDFVRCTKTLCRIGRWCKKSDFELVGVGQSEHEMQAEVMRWAKKAAKFHPEISLLFAIPNGATLSARRDQAGRRVSRQAVKLKAEGLKAGVPDMFLAAARGNWHGIFIEQKTRHGKVSSVQRAWLNLLLAQGYYALVSFSASETILVLATYLLGEGVERHETTGTVLK
jgi:hypothetical protein